MDDLNFKTNTVSIPTNTIPSQLSNQKSNVLPEKEKENEMILNGVIIETKDIDIANYLVDIIFRVCQYVMIADLKKDIREWPTENEIDEKTIIQVPPIKKYDDEKYIVDIRDIHVKVFGSYLAMDRLCSFMPDMSPSQ